jgi:hypothetical protein
MKSRGASVRNLCSEITLLITPTKEAISLLPLAESLSVMYEIRVESSAELELGLGLLTYLGLKNYNVGGGRSPAHETNPNLTLTFILI